MKKKWRIEVSQNGWEYHGWVTFYADTVERKSDTILIVDGYEMEFDEKVLDPQEET